MKRRIVIGIVAGALVATGALAVYLFLGPSGRPMTEVVPAGAVVYFQQGEPAAKVERLLKTELAKEISALPLREAFDVLEAADAEKDLVDQVMAVCQKKSNQEIVKALFGREVALAVYPVMLDGPGASWKDALAQVAVLTRLATRASFDGVVVPLVRQMRSDIDIQTVPYKKHTIHLVGFKEAGLRFGFVQIGDIMVGGLGDTMARRAVDVATGTAPSLSTDALFLKAEPYFAKGSRDVGFVNYETVISLIRKQATAAAAALGPDQVLQALGRQEEFFRRLSGFQAVVYTAVPHGDMIEWDTVTLYDIDQMHPDFRAAYVARPKANRSIDLIPSDTLAYYWQSGIDFRNYWEQGQEQMRALATGLEADEEKSPERFIQSIEDQFAVSIERAVLPILGDEFGWCLADFQGLGPIVIPDVVFFLKVTDAKAAGELIQQIVGRITFLQADETQRDGHSVWSVRIPMVSDLEPALAVIKDYMVLGTKKATVEKMIDTAAGTVTGLGSVPVGKDGRLGLMGPQNMVSYVNSAELMGKTGALVDAAGYWSEMQDSRNQALRDGAEQRLREVAGRITEREQEFLTVEAEALALQAEDEAAPAIDPQKQEEVVSQRERQAKVVDNAAARITELEGEQARLIKARDAEGQTLSPEGEQRLAEINGELVSRRERLARLKESLAAVEAEYQGLERASSERISRRDRLDTAAARLQEIRNQMRADEEIREEIRTMIAGYAQAQSFDEDQRRFILDRLVKPFLSALKNIEWAVMNGSVGAKEMTIKSFLKIR